MKPLLIAVLFAAAGFAASPATSMLVQTRRVFVSTNGSTVVTAHSFEYPDPSGVTMFPGVLLIACTTDPTVVGFSVQVNFITTSILPVVQPLPRPIPGGWASCGATAVFNPIWSIASVAVSMARFGSVETIIPSD